MAVLFMEGFDGIPNTSSTTLASRLRLYGIPSQVETTRYQTLTTGRYGHGYAYYVQYTAYYGGGYVGFRVPVDSLTSGSAGMAYKPLTYYTSYNNFTLEGASAPVILNYSSATTATLSYAPGTVDDFSVELTIPEGWVYLEFSWSPSGVSLYADSVLLHTENVNIGAVTEVGIGGSSYYNGTSGSVPKYMIDDMYITDSSTPLGEVVILNLAPTSTVTNTGTVTGSSAHAALGAYDGDTSYVAHDTVGQLTQVGLADITDDPTEIIAIQIDSIGKKSSTGFASTEYFTVTGSKVAHAESLLTATYEQSEKTILESDPDDSSNWTKEKVNSLEVGIERTI